MTFPTPPGFPGGITIETSWRNRLREAAYTPPSGTRLRFDWESVSRSFDKRSTPFEFSGVDDAYVQQHGNSSRRYPILAHFWGNDCDRAADTFEAALFEDGVGRLEHPVYGPINVVPFGTVERRDDLKTEANQAIVQVTFWTTLAAVWPSAGRDPKNEILGAALGFDAFGSKLSPLTPRGFRLASARNFKNATNLVGTVRQASVKALIRKYLRTVSGGIGKISGAVLAVNKEFRSIQSLVNFGLDVLIGQPLALALQITNLITAPARALSGIESRLNAYADLAADILASPGANPGEALASGTSLALRTDKIANEFHTADLFSMSAVAGQIVAAVADPIDESGQPKPGATFATRTEALAAGVAIAELFDRVTASRDAGFAALGAVPLIDVTRVDTGEAIQSLRHAVSLTLGHLIQSSFSLRPQKAIRTDRARTILDLAAELYPNRIPSAQLDALINSNSLTGSEILELPPGRRIVYYP